MPDETHAPIEEYLKKIAACIQKYKIRVSLGEEFQEIKKDKGMFNLMTSRNHYRSYSVVLAFGSNIQVDLGIYGEAKTFARKLENSDDLLGGISKYCRAPYPKSASWTKKAWSTF